MRFIWMLGTAVLLAALSLMAIGTSVQALDARGVEFAERSNHLALVVERPTAAGLQASPAYSPGIQAMVDAVSPTLLVHHVCKLQDDDALAYCNALGTRYSRATAKLGEAAQYLYDQYTALGLSVTYDAFIGWSRPMTNVVAELPGVGPGSEYVYIICAHYDSVSQNPYEVAPGADDNASGSAAVLEAARILSGHQFAGTLRFVHFAGEELGLLGSAHYAEQAFARRDVIKGVVNLDMIAYESVPPNDHIVEIHSGADDPASVALADALIQNVDEYGLLLTPQKITVGATRLSDHASFWNYGYPAILGIEDFDDLNPYYHSKDDTLANMRTDMMVEFTKASIATLAELASLPAAAETPTPSASPTGTPLPTPTAKLSRTATPVYRCYLPVLVRAATDH